MLNFSLVSQLKGRRFAIFQSFPVFDKNKMPLLFLMLFSKIVHYGDYLGKI